MQLFKTLLVASISSVVLAAPVSKASGEYQRIRGHRPRSEPILK